MERAPPFPEVLLRQNSRAIIAPGVWKMRLRWRILIPDSLLDFYKLKRMQVRLRNVEAIFRAERKKLLQSPIDWNKVHEHERDEFEETRIYDDEIAILRSRRMIRLANRYLVPTPRFNPEPGGDWGAVVRAWRVVSYHAGPSGTRSAIRSERRERREQWLSWTAGLTGLIGALIGIVSVWKD